MYIGHLSNRNRTSCVNSAVRAIVSLEEMSRLSNDTDSLILTCVDNWVQNIEREGKIFNIEFFFLEYRYLTTCLGIFKQIYYSSQGSEWWTTFDIFGFELCHSFPSNESKMRGLRPLCYRLPFVIVASWFHITTIYHSATYCWRQLFTFDYHTASFHPRGDINER